MVSSSASHVLVGLYDTYTQKDRSDCMLVIVNQRYFEIRSNLGNIYRQQIACSSIVRITSGHRSTTGHVMLWLKENSLGSRPQSLLLLLKDPAAARSLVEKLGHGKNLRMGVQTYPRDQMQGLFREIKEATRRATKPVDIQEINDDSDEEENNEEEVEVEKGQGNGEEVNEAKNLSGKAKTQNGNDGKQETDDEYPRQSRSTEASSDCRFLLSPPAASTHICSTPVSQSHDVPASSPNLKRKRVKDDEDATARPARAFHTFQNEFHVSLNTIKQEIKRFSVENARLKVKLDLEITKSNDLQASKANTDAEVIELADWKAKASRLGEDMENLQDEKSKLSGMIDKLKADERVCTAAIKDFQNIKEILQQDVSDLKGLVEMCNPRIDADVFLSEIRAGINADDAFHSTWKKSREGNRGFQ